jgi:hypothetical protein
LGSDAGEDREARGHLSRSDHDDKIESAAELDPQSEVVV